jgi:hypothetical protein
MCASIISVETKRSECAAVMMLSLSKFALLFVRNHTIFLYFEKKALRSSSRILEVNIQARACFDCRTTAYVDG